MYLYKSGNAGNMQITELLVETARSGASDLFISAGKPPSCRRNGKLQRMGTEIAEASIIDSFRQGILSQISEKCYREKGSYDVGLTLREGLRFRINFLVRQGMPSFVARPIPSGLDLKFKELNLPSVIEEFADSLRGLILIAGSAGSGKSTTMAAIMNHINSNYEKHIVSIEDPIEFIHTDRKSLITQREIGSDTSSFGEALKNVVRESPDVIIIGEMRDLETMQTAITAALTGHLVISTVHTADTVQAVERIINHFPEHLRAQAADDLSLAIRGIIAQRLIKTKDGTGMMPAVEVLKSTPHMKNLISARKYKELEEAIKRGSEEGMVTFTRAISELYKNDKISLKDGIAASTNPDEFLLLAEGMESGIETFRDDFKVGGASEDEINMKRLLYSAVANNASDLILSAGSPPSLRVNGDLCPLEAEPLTGQDTKRLLFSIITPRQRAIFEEQRELDFAMTLDVGKAKDGKQKEIPYRFRVNAFFQRGNVTAAVRVISQTIPDPVTLGIPQCIVNLTDKKHGLILVTGPTGHGKSTTLASMIDRINEKRACHIITVEDPIEYVHGNKKAIVEQREVHADTLSFSNALKYVLRQDPDVILIGEMRDTETIAAALTAAETGHLVMATLHTNDAPQSIDRIIDSFPAHQQNQIKVQLAGTLLGIIAQRLIPLKSGKGRVAAFEVLIGNSGAKALIREGKTHLIQSTMETGARDGMVTMEKALKELYSRGVISKDDVSSLTPITERQASY